MALWLPLAIGTGLGALQGRANEKRQEDLDEGRKAAIRYSWASGLKDPGPQSAGPGMLGSALQGGLTGAMIGQAGQSAGWWGKAADGASKAAGAGAQAASQGAGQQAMNQAVQSPVASPAPMASPQTPSYLMNNESYAAFNPQTPTTMSQYAAQDLGGLGNIGTLDSTQQFASQMSQQASPVLGGKSKWGKLAVNQPNIQQPGMMGLQNIGNLGVRSPGFGGY